MGTVNRDVQPLFNHHQPSRDHRYLSGHQQPQHVITALAHVAQAGEPLHRLGQQLRRVCAGDEPGDEEGWGVVRAQRDALFMNGKQYMIKLLPAKRIIHVR